MAGLFKKIGLAGDRLLKSWHQQIEGLRLRLGGSSKTKRCDAPCRDDGMMGSQDFVGILGSARLGKYVKHAVDKEPQRVATLVQLGC